MGAPSIKVKKVEIWWDKIGLAGCKWSSLNAPGSETPLCHLLLYPTVGRSLSPQLFFAAWQLGIHALAGKWAPELIWAWKWKNARKTRESKKQARMCKRSHRGSSVTRSCAGKIFEFPAARSPLQHCTSNKPGLVCSARKEKSNKKDRNKLSVSLKVKEFQERKCQNHRRSTTTTPRCRLLLRRREVSHCQVSSPLYSFLTLLEPVLPEFKMIFIFFDLNLDLLWYLSWSCRTFPQIAYYLSFDWWTNQGGDPAARGRSGLGREEDEGRRDEGLRGGRGRFGTKLGIWVRWPLQTTLQALSVTVTVFLSQKGSS